MAVGGVKYGPAKGKGKKRRPGFWARALVKAFRTAQAFGRQVKDEIRATGKGKGGGLGGGSGQGSPRTLSMAGRGRPRAGWEPRDRTPFDADELRMRAEMLGAQQVNGRWVDLDGQSIGDLNAWVVEQEADDRPEQDGQLDGEQELDQEAGALDGDQDGAAGEADGADGAAGGEGGEAA